MIPLSHAMFCWNPADQGGTAKIVLHPDRNRISDAYQYSTGACWSHWREMETEAQRLNLLIEVWHAIIRDGANPLKVHLALLDIPEFHDMLSDDFPNKLKIEQVLWNASADELTRSGADQ